MQSIRLLPLLRFIMRNNFRKEITLILILKLLALLVIWGLFFSHSCPNDTIERPKLVDHFMSDSFFEL